MIGYRIDNPDGTWVDYDSWNRVVGYFDGTIEVKVDREK